MSRQPWSKPTITLHQGGVTNKFGTPPPPPYQEALDGIPIDQLVSQYGSPLFVISEQQLRSNLRQLKRAFETRYPKVIHAWSYKTNYLGAVCNILHQEGSWAEVVSDFEYERARDLGVPGNRILFNGPGKSESILQRAVDDQAHIHIDHWDELHLLEKIAERTQQTIAVTLRLNFDSGVGEVWGRFGFNIESGEAMQAAKRIADGALLKISGLHAHIGTFITDPLSYSAEVTTLCRFMEQLEMESNTVIESIDIGGGFASGNALQGNYLPPEQITPSYEQYAEAICTPLRQFVDERRKRLEHPAPTLFLESGRAVVDSAGSMITSVVANKRLADGRRSVVMDAGVNLLFTAFWYNHQIMPTRSLQGIAEETVLYGPLCMNIDVIRHSIMLPPLSVGEPLLIRNTGAYNNTQWMQFIQYRPNVVLIHGTEDAPETSLIRKAEHLEVVTAQEQIPDHLRHG